MISSRSEFAVHKLKKAGAKNGTFLLRRSPKEYDKYFLMICLQVTRYVYFDPVVRLVSDKTTGNHSFSPTWICNFNSSGKKQVTFASRFSQSYANLEYDTKRLARMIPQLDPVAHVVRRFSSPLATSSYLQLIPICWKWDKTEGKLSVCS